jgi:hypothetical protein
MDRLSDRTIIYLNHGQKKEKLNLMTSGSRPRLKTRERASSDKLPPLRLTRRDLEAIQHVFVYRALTTPQIEVLDFAPTQGRPYSRKKRCQTRLKLLYHHGYLHRDEQPTKLSEGRQPLVYTLDTKGVALLSDVLDLTAKEIEKRSNPQLTSTSNLFLRHLLKTNDVRIAMTLAAQRQGVVIKEWLDDYDLHRDYDRVTLLTDPKDPDSKSQKVPVIPDGYFWLWTGKKNYHNLIEADRKTSVLAYKQRGRKDWTRRFRAYKEYYHSGLYQQRFPEAKRSMRVLSVTDGQVRLAHLVEIAEKVAGKDKARFWFTTFDRLTPETALTDPVWQVAGRDGLQSLIW